ncbi:MAG: type II toxin-antitoxin system RelE/ParE family toxin [Pirellulaceae bacterium]|nr:type II toxin-antitoxin system RelE/ParE family toxin [Pirellulaceae bacterium]
MSSIRVAFVPAAEVEYEEARQWYEEQRPGLGQEFAMEIDACLERIRHSPEMYARIKNNYRQALVRRFPYAIYYEFDGELITVYAVFHGSRDPKTLNRRLR